MKKYTHAWLAFKAIERLEKSQHSAANQGCVDGLVKWFRSYRDDVIQGAWYPDAVIKDMSTSHVLKITPAPGTRPFRKLPTSHLMYQKGKNSDLHGLGFCIDEDTNLPDRCEAIAHSLVDNLKMQSIEDKGSPICPTNNHVAVLMFMLSHYIADAHVPFHCDSRCFSSGENIHGEVEEKWDEEVKTYYEIDKDNERFIYNSQGFPLFKNDLSYTQSILSQVETELANRPFQISWGSGNNNTWDFMASVCQYSYLLSYDFIPVNFDETNVTKVNWMSLPEQKYTFDQYSVAVLSDAVDSIARIWLRVWRKYSKWEKKQE
jgi:hypothetical protein